MVLREVAIGATAAVAGTVAVRALSSGSAGSSGGQGQGGGPGGFPGFGRFFDFPGAFPFPGGQGRGRAVTVSQADRSVIRDPGLAQQLKEMGGRAQVTNQTREPVASGDAEIVTTERTVATQEGPDTVVVEETEFRTGIDEGGDTLGFPGGAAKSGIPTVTTGGRDGGGGGGGGGSTQSEDPRRTTTTRQGRRSAPPPSKDQPKTKATAPSEPKAPSPTKTTARPSSGTKTGTGDTSTGSRTTKQTNDEATAGGYGDRFTVPSEFRRELGGSGSGGGTTARLF